jgi:hypothetical protein
MDMMVQCIKFDVIEDELSSTLQLNVLGIVYSASMPKHETSDAKNVSDCWQQLIQSFGICHMLGQKGNIQHGSRELTEEESEILEAKN